MQETSHPLRDERVAAKLAAKPILED